MVSGFGQIALRRGDIAPVESRNRGIKVCHRVGGEQAHSHLEHLVELIAAGFIAVGNHIEFVQAEQAGILCEYNTRILEAERAHNILHLVVGMAQRRVDLVEQNAVLSFIMPPLFGMWQYA